MITDASEAPLEIVAAPLITNAGLVTFIDVGAAFAVSIKLIASGTLTQKTTVAVDAESVAHARVLLRAFIYVLARVMGLFVAVAITEMNEKVEEGGTNSDVHLGAIWHPIRK